VGRREHSPVEQLAAFFKAALVVSIVVADHLSGSP